MTMFKAKQIGSLTILLILSIVFFSCNRDNNNSDENISSKEINIYLTDCPFDADEVNVELLEIKIEEEDGTFTSLNTQTGIYNLLDFQNGVDVLIATGVLAIQDIKNVYFELGEENHIVIDGEEHPLILDDNLVKVKFALGNILGDSDFVVEFYACNSIIEENGNYYLKPVIKFKGERLAGGNGNNILDLADLLEFFEDCYQLVYPVTIEDKDGNLFPVNNKEELNEVLVNNDDLKLVYPISLESINGDLLVVNQEKDVEELALDCFEENNLSALEQILVKLRECYELVYPISFKGTDGEVFTVNNEAELAMLFNDEDIKDVVLPADLLDEDGNTMTVETYEDLIVLIMNCN